MFNYLESRIALETIARDPVVSELYIKRTENLRTEPTWLCIVVTKIDAGIYKRLSMIYKNAQIIMIVSGDIPKHINEDHILIMKGGNFRL